MKIYSEILKLDKERPNIHLLENFVIKREKLKLIKVF